MCDHAVILKPETRKIPKTQNPNPPNHSNSTSGPEPTHSKHSGHFRAMSEAGSDDESVEAQGLGVYRV